MIETMPEQEAAIVLFKGHPPEKALSALKKLRYAKKINCIKAGNLISYTEKQLMEYIGDQECKNTQSVTSGSAKEKAEKSGTSHGTTMKQDKRVISLVAQETFGKRKL